MSVVRRVLRSLCGVVVGALLLGSMLVAPASSIVTPESTEVTSRVKSVAVCDFDGNGKTDLFHRRASDGQWFIAYNGSKTWMKTKVSSVRFSRLMFADMTGDGACDVVFRQNDGKWRYSSKGKGRWTTFNSSNAPADRLALCDFNGNGKADVFTRRDSDGQWSISYDGTSNWSKTKVSTVRFSRLMFADVTGDGACDVVFRQNTGKWRYSSKGEGRWTTFNSSGAPADQVALCDFDGNGRADLFHRRGSDGQWLISYNGSSNWSKTKVSTVRFSRLMFADMTGDGDCDVVFVQSNNAIRYSSQGKGRWTTLASLNDLEPSTSTSQATPCSGRSRGDHSCLAFSGYDTWAASYTSTSPHRCGEKVCFYITDAYGAYIDRRGHNCVGYVAYRLKQDGIRTFSARNANVLETANPHFDRSKKPQVGALAQWEAGAPGAHAEFGHVAYVEKVFGDGTILISESNWGGTDNVKRIKVSQPSRYLIPKG